MPKYKDEELLKIKLAHAEEDRTRFLKLSPKQKEFEESFTTTPKKVTSLNFTAIEFIPINLVSKQKLFKEKCENCFEVFRGILKRVEDTLLQYKTNTFPEAVFILRDVMAEMRFRTNHVDDILELFYELYEGTNPTLIELKEELIVRWLEVRNFLVVHENKLLEMEVFMNSKKMTSTSLVDNLNINIYINKEITDPIITKANNVACVQLEKKYDSLMILERGIHCNRDTEVNNFMVRFTDNMLKIDDWIKGINDICCENLSVLAPVIELQKSHTQMREILRKNKATIHKTIKLGEDILRSKYKDCEEVLKQKDELKNKWNHILEISKEKYLQLMYAAVEFSAYAIANDLEKYVEKIKKDFEAKKPAEKADSSKSTEDKGAVGQSIDDELYSLIPIIWMIECLTDKILMKRFEMLRSSSRDIPTKDIQSVILPEAPLIVHAIPDTLPEDTIEKKIERIKLEFGNLLIENRKYMSKEELNLVDKYLTNAESNWFLKKSSYYAFKLYLTNYHLRWVRSQLPMYKGDITNFTTDWKSGVLLNTLLHSYMPVFSLQAMHVSTKEDNLHNTLDVLNTHLGLPLLLGVKDLLDQIIDKETNLLLIVSQIYHYDMKSKGLFD